MAMPRHKGDNPGHEAVKDVVRRYRALQPHEKLIALYEMGFTKADAEDSVMREMRRAAKEAIETFQSEEKQERLKHRPNAPVLALNGDHKKGDGDLVVKDPPDNDDSEEPEE